MVFCGMLHSLNKIEESNSEESNIEIINLDTYQLMKQQTSTTIENSSIYNNYKHVTITGLNTPVDGGFYNDITMPQNIDFNVAIIHIEKETHGDWPGYYLNSNYKINLDFGTILESDQHRINDFVDPRDATVVGPHGGSEYWSLGEDILLIVRLYSNTLRTDLIQSKTPNDISNINLNNNNNIQISGSITYTATYNYNYNKYSLNDIEIRFRNRGSSNFPSYNTRKFNISLQNI